jgi:hypothetical protein
VLDEWSVIDSNRLWIGIIDVCPISERFFEFLDGPATLENGSLFMATEIVGRGLHIVYRILKVVDGGSDTWMHDSLFVDFSRHWLGKEWGHGHKTEGEENGRQHKLLHTGLQRKGLDGGERLPTNFTTPCLNTEIT